MDDGTNDAKARLLKGRREIRTRFEEIDAGNVVVALREALPAFWANRSEEKYLWDYYRGVQPILERVKDVRPEICNRIVVNHAREIVAFKIGYQFADTLQYTCRTYDTRPDGSVGPAASVQDNPKLRDVNELNTLMFAEDKASCDRDLFEWMCVTGVGYRMCEAETEAEEGSAPFSISSLDPRDTFVVRSPEYHHRPLMAVWVGRTPTDRSPVYNVYTSRRYYRVEHDAVVADRPHTYGSIPIVEYCLNNDRMGVFEPVLPLLDAINAVESNRLDGIEQTVQSLMKFVNCDVDAEAFTDMLKLGAVKVTSMDGVQGDVDVISNDLDQTQTQVTKDDLYQCVLNICGMPNRPNSSGGTSDTGAAVMLREGWTLAESHAKSYELQFAKSERDFLRVALAICNQSSTTHVDLNVRDIELSFNRRNYENIQTKSQVLISMLASEGIHPELAFKACGLFPDAEAAYLQSLAWVEERARVQEEQEERLLAATGQPSQIWNAHNGQFQPNGEQSPKLRRRSQPTVPEPRSGDGVDGTDV